MPRVVGVTCALVLLVTGCGNGQSQPRTQLTITALNSWVGRSVFHLNCGPEGGDLPDPGRACAAIAADPRLLTRPQPFTCMGGTASWWKVTATGRLDRKAISRSFSTCWTPQMATIGKLGLSWELLRKHLVRRRNEMVFAGTQRDFPSGVLRAADLITCEILGHHLRIGVPTEVGPPASTGFGGANIVTVTLTASLNRDGSVSARCLRGRP
jgi:hypothetical protein